MLMLSTCSDGSVLARTVSGDCDTVPTAALKFRCSSTRKSAVRVGPGIRTAVAARKLVDKIEKRATTSVGAVRAIVF